MIFHAFLCCPSCFLHPPFRGCLEMNRDEGCSMYQGVFHWTRSGHSIVFFPDLRQPKYSWLAYVGFRVGWHHKTKGISMPGSFPRSREGADVTGGHWEHSRTLTRNIAYMYSTVIPIEWWPPIFKTLCCSCVFMSLLLISGFFKEWFSPSPFCKLLLNTKAG